MIQTFPLQCATTNPDGQKRALVIGGGIANFTDVSATFSGIIRALKEKVNLSIHHHTAYSSNDPIIIQMVDYQAI